MYYQIIKSSRIIPNKIKYAFYLLYGKPTYFICNKSTEILKLNPTKNVAVKYVCHSYLAIIR